MTNALLEPFQLGPLKLRNRIVMAPLTRVRSNPETAQPPESVVEYYRQRAEAGLLIAEAVNISPTAKGAVATPGIWTEAHQALWTKAAAAVHAEGGAVFMQLWHTGRLSHVDLQPGGVQPVSASDVQAVGQTYTQSGLQDYSRPRPLRADEIPMVVEEYRQAAQRAKAAGFDGVEIHSANNYLLEQFIRDSTNRRTDEYGGAIANRLRFPLAVARAVREVWGPGRVGVRISPTTEYGGAPLDSTPMETYGAYIDALNELDLAYLHVIEGITMVSRAHDKPVDNAALRARFNGPYIANNCFGPADGDEAVRTGKADLVSFGRPFIANPDLVARIRRGGPIAEAPKQYWYGGGDVGYTDWPAMR